MTAQQWLAPAEEPLEAAPLAVHYPQFTQENVPPQSRAITAWKGILRPFPNDTTAREVLRRLDANKPFDICAGTILADQESTLSLSRHWAEPRLVDMEITFTMIVLEYAGSEHPRAFAITPQISRHMFPCHPYLLDGITALFGRHQLPALCVYSGAHYRYVGTVPRIVEFLDQVTTYLARHMIWRRTRCLFEASGTGVNMIYMPRPGEPIMDNEPRLKTDLVANSQSRSLRFWDGYWPGVVAPQTPSEHIRTISPEQECWCCRGKPYGECCRPRDLAQTAIGSHLRH